MKLFEFEKVYQAQRAEFYGTEGNTYAISLLKRQKTSYCVPRMKAVTFNYVKLTNK